MSDPSPQSPHVPTTPPRSPLDTLRQREFFGIQGKFHSHVTVKTETADEVERLRAFCRAHRVKVTIIDLDDFKGRAQRDIMTTQHYRIQHDGAVLEIIDQLDALAQQLGEAGFEVIRVKLEHESLPTLPRFDGTNYREIHVKLHIQPDAYEETMRWLRAESAQWGYVPSSNPRAIHGDHIVQFVNLRIYEGSLDETEATVRALASELETRGLDVVEIKRETAVFDTNLDLDSWWA